MRAAPRVWALPRVTFSDPEIGSGGLTEEAARSRGIVVRTGMAQIPESTRGWIHKAGNRYPTFHRAVEAALTDLAG